MVTDADGIAEIPRVADLLISVGMSDVEPHVSTFLWMYGLVPGKIVIFDHIKGPGVMKPFPELGIPSINVWNSIYVRTSPNVKITVTLGHLDRASRYAIADPDLECKVRHYDGRIYIVHGRGNEGYSINFLAPICFGQTDIELLCEMTGCKVTENGQILLDSQGKMIDGFTI